MGGGPPVKHLIKRQDLENQSANNPPLPSSTAESSWAFVFFFGFSFPEASNSIWYLILLDSTLGRQLDRPPFQTLCHEIAQPQLLEPFENKRLALFNHLQIRLLRGRIAHVLQLELVHRHCGIGHRVFHLVTSQNHWSYTVQTLNSCKSTPSNPN